MQNKHFLAPLVLSSTQNSGYWVYVEACNTEYLGTCPLLLVIVSVCKNGQLKGIVPYLLSTQMNDLLLLFSPWHLRLCARKVFGWRIYLFKCKCSVNKWHFHCIFHNSCRTMQTLLWYLTYWWRGLHRPLLALLWPVWYLVTGKMRELISSIEEKQCLFRKLSRLVWTRP